MATVAYRVTRSRRAFVNAPVVRRVLEQALDHEVVPHFTRALYRRVANWEHQPDFKVRKSSTADMLMARIYPAGPNKDIYIFVSGGTRAHLIPKVPKTNGTLAFMWGGKGSYRAKTGTGGFYGGPGTVAGGKMTFRKQVKHPGNKARNFEKFVVREETPWFSRTMKNAWQRAIRAMNR